MSSSVARGASTGTILAVATAALLWGVYWAPLKLLEGSGLPAPWSAAFLVIASLFVAVPWAFLGHSRNLTGRQTIGAAGIGLAIALYSTALGYSDVVRVVLLFYMAPAWSLLIEVLFFRRRWTWLTTAALVLSFTGLVTVMRGEVPLEGLGAVGDWMALGGGLAWSVGAAFLFADKTPSLQRLTVWSLVAGALFMVALLLIDGTGIPPVLLSAFDNTLSVASTAQAAANAETGLNFAFLPTAPTLWMVVVLGLGLAAIYVVPTVAVTLWGANRLPPATMSFLMTVEIVSGVGTAALFLGERFGWPEALGTLLIVSGALIEVLWPAPQTSQIDANQRA